MFGHGAEVSQFEVVVLLTVLVVLSSAKFYSHEGKNAVAEEKGLGARIIKLFDTRKVSALKQLSAKRSEMTKAKKDKKEVDASSKETLSSVGVVYDGYFIQSSKANSDCTGASNEIGAMKMNTCFEGTKFFCSPEEDSVRLMLKNFENADCSGAYELTMSVDLPRCAMDTEAFEARQGVRKMRSSCVLTLEMPIPAAGAKIVFYGDAACTHSLMYHALPYDSCEMVQDGNAFYYVKFTGLTSDFRRKFGIYSDASCVHKTGGYADEEGVDMHACHGPDEDGMYAKYFITTA